MQMQIKKKKFLKLLKRFALSEDNGNQNRAASHRVTFTEFYWTDDCEILIFHFF